MKKRYLFLIVLIVVEVLSGIVYEQNYKEFEIVYSYKVSTDNFESVTLQVIVNAWNYNVEEMLCKVRDFYCENNGKVNKLRINLYDSKLDFEKSKCRICKSF